MKEELCDIRQELHWLNEELKILNRILAKTYEKKYDETLY